ncbi:hypothetical protein Tco_0201693 [Tanacetum coccineum]
MRTGRTNSLDSIQATDLDLSRHHMIHQVKILFNFTWLLRNDANKTKLIYFWKFNSTYANKIGSPKTPSCYSLFHKFLDSNMLSHVDYDVDPRVPIILERPFLRTEKALIDIHGKEMTLRVNDEAITFKIGHTLRYSHNYYDETVHQVNVIYVACEEYDQEVLRFLDSSTSGNPTPSDPIIISFSPRSLLLREGDIRLLEKLLNEDPSPTPPPMKNDDLKQVDVTMTKPSTEEPPKLKLKDLPSHLEYAFLEGTDKLPIIISKELKDEEKAALS